MKDQIVNVLCSGAIWSLSQLLKSAFVAGKQPQRYRSERAGPRSRERFLQNQDSTCMLQFASPCCRRSLKNEVPHSVLRLGKQAQEGAVSSLRPPELPGPGGIRIEVSCRQFSFTTQTSPANGGVTPRAPLRWCLI